MQVSYISSSFELCATTDVVPYISTSVYLKYNEIYYYMSSTKLVGQIFVPNKKLMQEQRKLHKL